MIPNEKKIRVVDTTTGEKVDMKIDEDSLGFIIGVLTDLYSDTEMACIREYSTNAFDAQQEIGVTRPIEVSTPSSLRPLLVIRDYGPGMDAEDIRRTYSKYGASTKRESNDLSGVLGLGSKSALTYTSQFTVKGVKNGIRTLVSVSRNKAGSGTMTILEEAQTSEPSGVEIQIPTRSAGEFAKKANEFFQYWDKGTVLLNGKEPTCLWEQEGLFAIDSNTFIAPTGQTYGDPQHMIVMGNVAYPLPINMRSVLSGGYRVIKRVEIGEIEFTPNREALLEGPDTKKAVAKIEQEVKQKAIERIQSRISEAKDAPEAWDRWTEADAMFDSNLLYESHNFEYKGKMFPKHSRRGYGRRLYVESEHWHIHLANLDTRSKETWIQGDQVKNTVLIKNFPLKKFTKKHALKLRILAEKKGLWKALKEGEYYGGRDQKQFLATEKDIKFHETNGGLSEWMDPTHILDWDDIKIVKIDKENVAVKSTEGSYRVFTKESSYKQMSPAEIEKIKKENLFWTSDSYYAGSSNIFEFLPDAVVIYLPSTRVAKFKRLFPHGRGIAEAYKEIPKHVKVKMTEDEIEKHHIRHYIRQKGYTYTHLLDECIGMLGRKADQIEKIEDPDVRMLASISNLKDNAEFKKFVNLERWLKNRQISATLMGSFDESKAKRVIKTLEKVSAKYPLLEQGRGDRKAIETYINAVYQYEKKEEV